VIFKPVTFNKMAYDNTAKYSLGAFTTPESARVLALAVNQFGRPRCFAVLLVFSTLFVASGCSRPDSVPDTPVATETVVVTGILIDSRCHSSDPSHVSNDHVIDGELVKACATKCAKLGFPTAILEASEDGSRVWMLVANAQALADYMAGTVRVTGSIRSEGVLVPDRVELQSGDTWTIIM
jgi:hypothetical protein